MKFVMYKGKQETKTKTILVNDLLLRHPKILLFYIITNT
jgi:hypothetical protein